MLEPPVDADHHDGEEDEERRLDGVHDEGGGADQAHQNEALKKLCIIYQGGCKRAKKAIPSGPPPKNLFS